ncbi:MAG: lipopolysaccharide assembly protein LapB [Neptuniibacter caesariensis]|uniref:Lipopolysaccharide assembly protein B n=1 Tax=Neptuniibacter caesariensis TaxID=207954 RepID=A0A2G6JKI8_NEPCE|nr:MAG: lipopolysaccharide assembly protein LapB [Neptuniibacter caesariensis]
MPFSPDNLFQLAFLVIAIAIGWLLGRRECAKSKAARPQTNISHEYFTGLEYLLNEKMDEAIESFIRALEINSDTVPAHLALAKLFRRKGDVDRAIQIHQNLLARPDLTRSDFMRIEMALARDYYAVGLLDRAENLLQEIIKSKASADILAKAQVLLIKLYEKEGEWEDALNTADKLPQDKRKQLLIELTHYYCELAENCIRSKQLKKASELLKKAEQMGTKNVRVNLLKAKISMHTEQWKSAIRSLKAVAKQDKLFVSETIPYLKQCYTRLGDLNAYTSYLKSSLTSAPSTTVIVALAEQIKEERGAYAAGSFITEELKRRPSVKGFNSLIDLHLEHGSVSAKDSLKVLRGLTGQLELSKPVYRCNSCGFSGRNLLWQCPSCKSWGTTKPIQGLEGE